MDPSLGTRILPARLTCADYSYGLYLANYPIQQLFRARIEDGKGHCRTSSGRRRFCKRCATALWLDDPQWPELVHPFASVIDTPLPVPPSRVHMMLRFKPAWVVPHFGRGAAVGRNGIWR